MIRDLKKYKEAMDNFPIRKLDTAIYGLQVQNEDLYDWAKMKKIVKKGYDVNMNKIGPVVTEFTLNVVNLAREITENIKNNEKIRDFADKSGITIKTTHYDFDDENKIIDGIIFLMVFRILTGMCFHFSKDEVKKYLENGVSEEFLNDLFSIRGYTIRDTSKDIEGIVKRMIESMK